MHAQMHVHTLFTYTLFGQAIWQRNQIATTVGEGEGRSEGEILCSRKEAGGNVNQSTPATAEISRGGGPSETLKENSAIPPLDMGCEDL